MLVATVFIGVYVDVGECAAVGILGVSNARDLQPHETTFAQDAAFVVGLALVESLPSVVAGFLSVAAYGLVGGDGLGSVHTYEPDGCGSPLSLDRYGVSVGYLHYLAVEGVRPAHTVDQTIEAEPRYRIEEQGEDEGYGDEDPLGVAARYYTVLITTGEDCYEAGGPEELDAAQGHHVGEEVRSITYEHCNDDSGSSEHPPQRQSQDDSHEYQSEQAMEEAAVAEEAIQVLGDAP